MRRLFLFFGERLEAEEDECQENRKCERLEDVIFDSIDEFRMGNHGGPKEIHKRPNNHGEYCRNQPKDKDS